MVDLSIPLYNGLDKLAKRVVRGAMPCRKNNTDSGFVFISTTSGSDDYSSVDVEYLLLPESSYNIISFLGTASFTNSSKEVELSVEDVNIKSGMFIRPGTGGRFFKISSITGKTIELVEVFEGDTLTDVSIDILKLEFGDVILTCYENHETITKFEYNSSTGIWETVSGAEKDTTVATYSNDETKGTYSGFNYQTVPSEESNDPDVNITGTSERYLPKVSFDTTMVSVPAPIPDPSPLSNPSDYSKIKVSFKDADQSSFTSRTLTGLDKNCLLSYSNVGDGYKPLPKEASSLYIQNLKDFDTTSDISENFTGRIALLDSNGATINNIVDPRFEDTKTISVEVQNSSTDKKILELDSEFDVNSSQGIITLHKHGNSVPLVSGVFYKYDLEGVLPSFEIKSADVSFDNATEESFTDAVILTEGIDYSINSSNGILAFLNGTANPSKTYRISYLVGGASTSDTVILEDVDDLYTNSYPIVPDTVTLWGYDINGNKVPLTEGVDFKLTYTNGSIELTDSTKEKVSRIKITYTPALNIIAYAKATSEVDVKYKVIDVPIVSEGRNTVVTAYTDTTPTNITIKGYDKVILDTTNCLIADGKITLTKEYVALSMGYAYVTFTVNDVGLPYGSPVVRLGKSFTSGSNKALLESVNVEDCGVEQNTVIMIKDSYDSSKIEYGIVTNVKKSSKNTVAYFYPNLKTSFTNAFFYVSDKPIVFNSVTKNGVPIYCKDTGVGDFIYVNTDDSSLFRAGLMIKASSNYVGFISSVSIDNNIVKLNISPSIKSYFTSSELAITEAPVFEVGDKSLIPPSTIIVEGSHVVRLNPPASDNSPTRYEIYVEDNTFYLNVRSEEEGETLYSFDFTYTTTLLEVIEGIIENVGTAYNLSYEVLGSADLNTILFSDVVSPVKVTNYIQLPYCFTSKGSLWKKTDGTLVYSGLVNNDDYSVQSNGIILSLTTPIAKYDRFSLSYPYASNFGYAIAVISGKKIDTIKKNSQFFIAMDYYAPDEFFIQTMSELKYKDSIISTYLSDMEKAIKGASATGSEGVSASTESDNTDGGVKTKVFDIREKYLMSSLLWKISEFYTNRMKTFATEYKDLSGKKIGNNLLDGGLSNWTDVSVQATLGSSKYFPIGYQGYNPLEDGRFGSSYQPACDFYVANVKQNDNTYKGVLYSDEYDSSVLLTTGMKVSIEGASNKYTIEDVDTEGYVLLTENISGGKNVSSKDKVVSCEQFPITVYRVSSDIYDISFVDNKGYNGFYVESSMILSKGKKKLSEDLSLSYKISDDCGVTWSEKTATVSKGKYTLEDLADAIDESIDNENISVLVEEVYTWPDLASELSKAITSEWPVILPNTGSTKSYRDALTIRGLNANEAIILIITEDSPGWDSLGFKEGTYYGSNSIQGYNKYVSVEESSGINESNRIYSLLIDIDDKLKRGWIPASATDPYTGTYFSSGGPVKYIGDLSAITTNASKNTLAVLTEARESANEITVEDENVEDVTEAVKTSYTEAVEMIEIYDTSIAMSSSKSSVDEVFSKSINESTEFNASLIMCGIISVVFDRANANNSLTQNGYLSIESSSGDLIGKDPRIIYQDSVIITSSLLSKDTKVRFGSISGTVLPGSWSIPTSEKQSYTYTDSTVTPPVVTTYYSGYTTNSTAKFYMDLAITITNEYSDTITITTTSTSISIIVGTVTTTIAYSESTTLSSLVSRINNISGVSCVKNSSYADNYSYKTLIIRTGVLLAIGSDLGLVFGIPSDVVYYVTSDIYLINRATSALAMTYLSSSDIDERLTEIETSWKNEALVFNRESWLKYLLNRMYGTANMIVPLKRSYLNE